MFLFLLCYIKCSITKNGEYILMDFSNQNNLKHYIDTNFSLPWLVYELIFLILKHIYLYAVKIFDSLLIYIIIYKL